MTFWRTWDQFLRALIVGLTLATIGSFFGDQAWWLDVLADFKVQYAFAAALLFGAAAMRRKIEAVLALALLITNGWTVYSHLEIPDETPGELKIVGFNISFKNLDIAPALDFLRRENADFVAVVEVNDAWRKAFKRLSDIYPYQLFGPSAQDWHNKPHRIGLLAKRRWEETGIEWSEVSSRAYAVWVRFPAASSSLTVASVHLTNTIFHPARNQMAEAEELASMVKQFDGPVVLAGDFNMTPFSTRFGNLLRTSNLRRATGGLNTTWPVLLTPFGLSLDHVLVGDGVNHASMRTGPRLSSDHLPVIATFNLGK